MRGSVAHLMTIRQELREALDAVERAILLHAEAANSIKLDDLNLTVRERNALTNAGIVSVPELVAVHGEALMREPNFGRISLRHVKAELARFGLALAA